MAFHELALVATGFAVLAVTVGVMAGYLPRLRRATKEEREAAEILKDMLSHVTGRLAQQDHRIMDQQVRLDILEAKLVKPTEQVEEKLPESAKLLQEIRSMLAEARSKGADVTQRDVEAGHVVEPIALGSVNPTELQVLRLLATSPRTPRHIQQSIGRSREHASRLLKKLFEEGYVIRRDVRRPFVYELSPRGRQLLA